ncbi:hypothetical protein D7231_28615 [Streptomyces klenkii]|uniref:Uncharacterized protein n=1 Tax=Streptomyces klenkii TaxID=1420899 RepID=A0A3B0AUU1_9ACTN|nr:hypothetical protein D7231_28615 [Streptomyces klenkii]
MEQYHVGLYGYVTSHHIALRQCEHLTRGGLFRPAFIGGMLAQPERARGRSWKLFARSGRRSRRLPENRYGIIRRAG